MLGRITHTLCDGNQYVAEGSICKTSISSAVKCVDGQWKAAGNDKYLLILTRLRKKKKKKEKQQLKTNKQKKTACFALEKSSFLSVCLNKENVLYCHMAYSGTVMKFSVTGFGNCLSIFVNLIENVLYLCP